MNMMQKVYADAQASCGLKVGDCVKVTNRFEDLDGILGYGWTPIMNKALGMTGRIREIRSSCIQVYFDELNISLSYPYFALEKTEKPTHELKPFDRVLVRDQSGEKWKCDFFSHKIGIECYVCVSTTWEQCIPYEGNEHLVGTTDAPQE